MVSSNSSTIYLLPSSSSFTIVNNFNASSSLLLLTYDPNTNGNSRTNRDTDNNHHSSSFLSTCRIIVPYISRHVCPLMLIYLLEENFDHDDAFRNADERNNNDIDEQDQDHQNNHGHIHNNMERRRLRFISVILTSSCYANNSSIMEQEQQHRQQQQHQRDQDEQEQNMHTIIVTSKDYIHKVNIHHIKNHPTASEGKLYTCYNMKGNTKNLNIYYNYHYQPIHKVLLHIPNLLSYILSYLTPQDILQTTSYINKTFYECSRKDSLWKKLCIHKWRDKLNVPKLRKGARSRYHFFDNFYDRENEEENNNQNSNKRRKRNHYHGKNDYDVGLFWNTKVDPSLIHSNDSGLSIHDMKLMLIERPSLGRTEYRTRLYSCIEKHDLVKLILDYMPDCLGDVSDDKYGVGEDEMVVVTKEEATDERKIETKPMLRTGFRHLWFGSYASSIIDSKRTTMTLDELVSLKGFSLNFKVVISLNNVTNSRTTTGTSNNESSSSTVPTASTESSDGNHNNNIQLHYHCMCYFYEDYRFQTELKDEEERNHNYQGLGQQTQFHQHSLKWKWIEVGRILQIERYPQLYVTRLKNWGWKLENTQVVLLSQ